MSIPDATRDRARKRPKPRRRRPNRKLQELRLNAGLSPNQLAARAGVCGKTVRMAEAGWIPAPRTQFAIARCFPDPADPAGLRTLQPLDIWPLELQAVAR